ncbi:MAG: RagB/SusD family nutrient uptake outer membrane protein [Bacteroidota bacterium]
MKNRLFAIRTITGVCALSLAITFNSCKKALEVEPYSYFTSASFFKDVNEAYMATLGVYETMSSVNTYGWFIPMVFDNDTDIGQISGATGDQYRQTAHYQGIPETPIFYAVWSAFYAGIDRANTVIEKIPQMDLYKNGTTDQKTQLNRMLGEAKFLRSFYYFELVRLWGDVPFKTKASQAGDNLSTPLVNRSEIYTQIIKDMQDAADMLPATLPTDERVNKWAAKSLLARVALFAGGYSLQPDGTMKRPADYLNFYRIAQTQINEVMAANIYKLNPNYAQVFINQCQHVLDPTENIFQVAFYNPSGNPQNGSWFGYYNGALTATGLYAGSIGRCLTVRPFYNSFDTADWRRDFAIAPYSIAANGSKTQLFTARGDESWTAAKWSRPYGTNASIERTYTHINTVIMRYSDLLLMRAEVENELNGGPNVLAYDAVNLVRRRGFGLDLPGSKIAITLTNGGSGYATIPAIEISGGGGTGAAAAATTLSSARVSGIALLSGGYGYTSLPTITVDSAMGTGTRVRATVTAKLVPKPTAAMVDLSSLSKDNFLKAIQQERAWELCFEGMRRADLVRWNILGEKITETNTKVKAIRSNYVYPAFTNFVAGKHELYPFPQNETDVNKSITRQNPGY